MHVRLLAAQSRSFGCRGIRPCLTHQNLAEVVTRAMQRSTLPELTALHSTIPTVRGAGAYSGAASLEYADGAHYCSCVHYHVHGPLQPSVHPHLPLALKGSAGSKDDEDYASQQTLFNDLGVDLRELASLPA